MTPDKLARLADKTSSYLNDLTSPLPATGDVTRRLEILEHLLRAAEAASRDLVVTTRLAGQGSEGAD